MLDGIVPSSGVMVQGGQIISYTSALLPIHKVFPLSFPVTYEDNSLALIHKPAGYPVSGNRFKTILNALPHNLYASDSADSLVTPYPVHRLDEATSGLLLIAKTYHALHTLSQQFEKRSIDKYYEALVIGETNKQGIITQEIENHEAITEYTLLDTIPSDKFTCISKLLLHPLTGRKHQLRKHLSGIGHPILGDPLYTPGSLLLKGKGLFLCATQLHFMHPETDDILSFKLETPGKFNTLMRYFKITSSTT